MSLATRCPACSTVFRVVPDQLRVSEGWVRCGRCTEVFNALEQMVDVAAAPVAAAPGSGPGSAGVITSQNVRDADVAMPARPDQTEAQATAQATAQAATQAATRADDQAASEAADRDSARDPDDDAAIQARRDADADAAASASKKAAPANVSRSADEGAPSFMRAAQRAQRWQQPAVMRALNVVAVLALVTLALQIGSEYRDLIAARWPASRAALELLCRVPGCRGELPRMIEALVVDSSALVRVEGTPNYKFSLVLRNRAALELAMPAVDLSLTDVQGRVIARRALTAVELGAKPGPLAGGADLPMQATLAVADRPVAGYTIDFFYP